MTDAAVSPGPLTVALVTLVFGLLFIGVAAVVVLLG